MNAQRGGAVFLLLFGNAVMSDDVRSFFQNVLLISRLPWVIVVNDIGHSIFISPVRHDANMSFKDHNITALPLLRFGNIGGQFDRITGEKHLQVSHPAKVYILSGAVIPYSSGCSRMSVSTRACRSYPAFSEHMLPHQYRLHSRRRDNRSHNSGFCILDVYSHMPVRRSGCLSGRLHRHRLRLLCCAAAGSGQKIYPSVGQQKCADNGIKSNGKSRQQKHPHRPDCRFSLHLIFPL